MSDKGNDRIVCPGERPHNKRSGQGIVRKPNCERVLAFTSDLNEIEDLTIPCSGCGRLIRIKQSPEKGVVLENTLLLEWFQGTWKKQILEEALLYLLKNVNYFLN